MQFRVRRRSWSAASRESIARPPRRGGATQKQIDPIPEALREHPTARYLLQRQRLALTTTLHHHLPKPHWPLFLGYEALTESHAELRDELAFSHAFPLGRPWPLLDPPISTERRQALTDLARAAAKRNTPPLERLHILVRAALLSSVETENCVFCRRSTKACAGTGWEGLDDAVQVPHADREAPRLRPRLRRAASILRPFSLEQATGVATHGPTPTAG